MVGLRGCVMRFTNPFLQAVASIYEFIIRIGSNLSSVFLFYMRFTWGSLLINAGRQKLDSIFETAEFFASLNISFPYFNAHFVGWVELIGGLCLLFGFASRLAAIPVTLIMLTALSTAHAPNISNFRFLFEPLLLVKQTPYPFLITALLVLIFGPGRISIDAWLKRWAQKRPKY